MKLITEMSSSSLLLYPNAGHGEHSSGSQHELISTSCLADMVHEFLEQNGTEIGICYCGKGAGVAEAVDDDDDDNDDDIIWQDLATNLKDLVARTTDLENVVLADLKKIITGCTWRNKANREYCEAQNSQLKVECEKRFLVQNMLAAGYNAGLCASTWNHSKGLPGGKYVYVDIVFEDDDQSKNKDAERRLIIDLEFRSQFEVARPTEQYLSILHALPMIFVGGCERLQQLVKVMCDCVKTSVRKSCMSLPPWRKHLYMNAKWFSSYKRITDNLVGCYHQLRVQNIGGLMNADPSIIFMQQSDQKKFESSKGEKSQGQTVIHALEPEKEATKNFMRVPTSQEGCGHNPIPAISPGWQLPALESKSSSFKNLKVAGLASLLMETGWVKCAKSNPMQITGCS